MEQITIQQTISRVSKSLMDVGYAQSTVKQFKSTTNQLINFMTLEGVETYSTDVGLRFLQANYGYEATTMPTSKNVRRLCHLRKLSEFQLHGAAILVRKTGKYEVPLPFQEAIDAFLAHRRFKGIIEKNMSATNLYLERFLCYLKTNSVTKIVDILPKHVHGYLLFITGYSNASKDHMMRTVRQFMDFCFKNGYHPQNLAEFAPYIHYAKRSKLPSAYSREDVMKLINLVDRSNPVGKRDYAILLLIIRLGLRSGDVVNLKFENINWEENRISLTQHKTGRPLDLPLLEDVGLAIIDYLKFGRPTCDHQNIFIKHDHSKAPCTSTGMYNLV